jgi:hypothetical protein
VKLTDSAGAIVREAFDKLNKGDGPCGPWDAARNARKGLPLLLGWEWVKEIGGLLGVRVWRVALVHHGRLNE